MTKHKKKVDPTIDRVRASYYRQIELLEGFRAELDEAMRDFTQGHDAGLMSYRSGMGKFGRGSSGTDITRTTEAATYEFKRLRGACTYAGQLILETELDMKRATQRLERASSAILNAWLDTDPEIGRQRRDMRRAATQPDQTVVMPGIEQAVATVSMKEEPTTFTVEWDMNRGGTVDARGYLPHHGGVDHG